MPSFDIVSEVDTVELRNAVDNANRELSSRFDFRGVDAHIDLKETTVTLASESDFQVQQLHDIFANHCAKRNLSLAGTESPEELTHSGKTFSTTVTFKQGIEQPLAKKIVKLLKESKLKVQAAIQGDKVRVTGKKRDDLQQAMAVLRESDIELPLQFENFRD
ncbi:YajQ family cyclic di-GMP-binding protein [Pseudidiomarina terrestris]|uniref:Nucleotide-binding protein J6I90_08510 n=1 Tax=Pseudidiomarina terrestris TaxID=2820060 RepID=A0AAW7R1D6_9GAMM|nr:MULTISPECIES: YajQ family cyclic di-GMP-binding protein [unclassified Pseudidiomarina]MDN7124923.1 YajQ family cyclic di-GMP-binding protein [Pseudidiomarina sp. 1APP75-32.1]MDN7125996.1 YajQ family cyclic di-GMP-binding protein [Pseudidiomarina sp. 1APR75-33.1]MDN7129604.1 YajQ family cyclic di-GMP-binding protein [Pseudidiomarina sp. 1APR75-15]MDN7135919.1 YajQ family cyclic di-GMP-binding protein [Pseudidiomarina sp. 1ASP75-5]MDN7138143.1 YajQ family cyclic di-GMP-binding protein [Pseudi